MDFTTNQTLDQRALAQIEQAAHTLYSANARGEIAADHKAFKTLLDGIRQLARDCGHIQDAISDTFYEWECEEEAERMMGDLMPSYKSPALVVDYTR